MSLQVLMADWSVKSKNDLKVGDRVMSLDFKPRRVNRAISKEGLIYKIETWNSRTFTVGEETMLTLIRKANGSLHETTLNDFAKSHDYFKNACEFYGPKGQVENVEQPVPIDPFVLGAWLGCGNEKGAVFKAKACFVGQIISDFGQANGMILKDLSTDTKSCQKLFNIDERNPNNIFEKMLTDLNLIGNKHIPIIYLNNTIDVRQRLLRGILSTHYVAEVNGIKRIGHVNEKLMKDVCKLAKSLSLNASIRKQKSQNQHIVSIQENIDKPTSFGIKSITNIGKALYTKIGIDGDGYYLTNDFMIMMNDYSDFVPIVSSSFIELPSLADVSSEEDIAKAFDSTNTKYEDEEESESEEPETSDFDNDEPKPEYYETPDSSEDEVAEDCEPMTKKQRRQYHILGYTDAFLNPLLEPTNEHDVIDFDD
jgi:hypothetical protein